MVFDDHHLISLHGLLLFRAMSWSEADSVVKCSVNAVLPAYRGHMQRPLSTKLQGKSWIP